MSRIEKAARYQGPARQPSASAERQKVYGEAKRQRILPTLDMLIEEATSYWYKERRARRGKEKSTALTSLRNLDATDSATMRIDNALHDLEKMHAPIPHEALHAKALEILRGRTVAADDEATVNADAKARLKPALRTPASNSNRVSCGTGNFLNKQQPK